MSNATIACRYRLERSGFVLDAACQFAARGVTGLYGPSGSGKTTLLRCLAGLEPAARGELRIDGVTWDSDSVRLPAYRRRCGFVFQDARLFDHLDVGANLDYGAHRREPGLTPVQREAMMKTFDLTGLLGRMPRSLSGGERRRVAIGRALLSGPSLLLLDEPLGGLDAARRDEVLPFLERLHGALSIPMLLVSHRQDEVERLCDRLVVMAAGAVVEEGALGDVIELDSIAGIEPASIVDARIASHDVQDSLTVLDFAGGRFYAAGRFGQAGDAVRCLVRARDVSLCLARPVSTSILNVIDGIVTGIDLRDALARIRLQCGDTRLTAHITRRSARELALRPGSLVHAQIKSVAVRAAPHPEVNKP